MRSFARLAASGEVDENVGLAPVTTYKLGGPARYYVELNGEEQLPALAEALQDDPQPVLVIGRGSNLVISDTGWPGLAVRPGPGLAAIELEPEGVVTAGGATSLPRLARETVKAGRGGLEFYVGIPGSVGGAVRMNAGGHGSETAEWLLGARIFDLAVGARRELTLADLDFGYRSSSVGPADLVVSASFRTEPRLPEEGEAELRAITRWRRIHQPGGTLNAGSVFRNPEGDAAGRIIDELGLKGFQVRGAAVSKKHANFFEADAAASAQDVYDLVHEVQRRVAEKTGVELELEVQFAGRFA